MPETLIKRVETSAERALEEYVQTVRGHVEGPAPIEETVENIVQAQTELISPEFQMPDAYRRVKEGAPYTRNLVYQDPSNRFSVISICWGPFQETSVHDHIHWCVVGVLEGAIHAIDYQRLDDETEQGRARLAIHESTLHSAGSVIGLTPPPRTNIHKMSNGGHAQAISLHTYGDAGTKARVFAPVAGTFEIVDLEFHNP